MTIVARAPAKLVLFGEYAVLRGAPAVVAAVDRCATVTLHDRADGRWGVSTDLAGEAPVTLRPDADGRLAPAAGTAPAWARGVAEAIDGTLEAAGLRAGALPGADLRVETAPLHAEAGGAKLGLGSSAAVVVALAAALRRWLGDLGRADAPPSLEAVLAQDLATHARLQGGGSGVDVAASLLGGLIAYARAPGGSARAEPLRWPEGLQLRCLWTGHDASTADFLRRVDACARARPVEHGAAMERLVDLAHRARAAFGAGDAGAVVALAGAYHEALDSLGRTCGVAIVSEAHRALAEIARGAGATYKPSGAGGGDVGLLFGLAGDAVSRAVDRASAGGYPVVDLAVRDTGATVGAA